MKILQNRKTILKNTLRITFYNRFRISIKKEIEKTSFKKGFTLIELVVVLFILSILLTIGIKIYRDIFRFAQFKKRMLIFEQEKNLLLSASDSPEHLNLVFKKIHQKDRYGKLYLSQAFLRTFPHPCYIPEESSLLKTANFYIIKLKHGNKIEQKKVLFFYLNFGRDKKSAIKEIDDHTFLLDTKSDDFLYAPSLAELRYYWKCRERFTSFLDTLITEAHIYSEETSEVNYKFFLPEGLKLRIISPGEVKELENATEARVHVSPGINLIKFQVIKEGEVIQEFRDYVGVERKFDEEDEQEDEQKFEFSAIPLGVDATEELKAPLSVKFVWKIACGENSSPKCLLDFGDGNYYYFPECKSRELVYNYLFKGTFFPKLFVDCGNFTVVKKEKLFIAGIKGTTDLPSSSLSISLWILSSISSISGKTSFKNSSLFPIPL